MSIDDKTDSENFSSIKKGYYRSQFEEVFQRYLPSVTASEIAATPATAS